jgi:16S rRNA processing protein RimM
MKKDGLLEIGEVVKTSGLKGRIRAKSYLVSKDTAQGLDEVFIGRSKEQAAPFRISALQADRRMMYLELEGIEDVDAAARLVGGKIFILAENLAKLPQDEYYWHELLGLEVETDTGRNLGRISSIVPGVGHDLYVCTGPEREIMLPAVGEVILKVDIAAGVMVVRLIEGLA